MTFGEQNTEKEAHEMLAYAFDHGVNTLDTAEAVSFTFISLLFFSCQAFYRTLGVHKTGFSQNMKSISKPI